MSKLEALRGKSKTYKIGEIEIELHPLSIKDMELITIDDKSSVEEQQKASKKLITKTLKESIPDATDEEIDNIGFQYMEELMEAIMDVNGMNKNKNRKSLVEQRINAIKQNKGKSSE